MAQILHLVANTSSQALTAVFHFVTAHYFYHSNPPTPTSDSHPQSMKHILILGGSFAGISTAHRILKQAPATASFKITLVSPNDHFYWSLASPRGVIPGALDDEKIFQLIVPGFAHYPKGRFEFVLGTAEGLDVGTKKVDVLTANEKLEIRYDFLVLATGTRAKEGMPFKGLGSTEVTKDALHAFQNRIKQAKSIVVAGTGATGTETAGELGFEFGKDKEITLIASGPTLLAGTPPSVYNLAQKELINLNVQLRFNTKISSTSLLPTGQTELVFSTGENLVTDMYIPAFGLKPNSAYIPSQFLNSQGFVIVDEEYFTMKGAENVWAIGDVSSFENAQLLTAEKQSTHLAKNIALMLGAKAPIPYKAGTIPMGLSIGRKAGVGSYGGWRIPSFVIVFVRRNLFSENLGKMVDGSWS